MWHWSHLVLHGARFKLVMLMHYLSSFDYLLWIDIDAVFYNFDVRIETWIDTMRTHHASILLAEDIDGFVFNSGAMLVRSDAWSRAFLERSVPLLAKGR